MKKLAFFHTPFYIGIIPIYANTNYTLTFFAYDRMSTGESTYWYDWRTANVAHEPLLFMR